MNDKRRIIGIVSALVLATLGTVALMSYVRAAKDDAVADEALVGVYVVDAMVPKGADAAAITESVTLEQVPSRLQQPGAITDLAAIGDRVAAADLEPGDQLLDARLAAVGQVDAQLKDKVQVAAVFAPERAVGGTLRKGDLVGVYLSFDPFQLDEAGAASSGEPAAGGADTTAAPSHTPNTTRLEFQHVLVTNVQTIDAPVTTDGSDGDGVAQVRGSQFVVTLALSPEESERFVFAAEFGHLWLSSETASVSDDGTRLVTLGNVYEVVPG